MEISSIWLLLMAAATPIAGIVGFAVNLRQVKKLRLENQKLELEIESIKRARDKSAQRIVEVSNDDVLRYAHPPLFSRRATSHDHAMKAPAYSRRKSKFWEFAWGLAAIIVLAYLVYDLYRLFRWLTSAA